MKLRKLVPLASIILLTTSLSFGQGIATGDLHVVVKDPKGNLLNGATVVASDQGRGVERQATSSGAGEYRILALPPGTYTVTVDASGFAKATGTNVVVTIGQLTDLPVSLAIAGTQETINVSAASEVVETERSSSTNTINQRAIDNLPINGRNYINFTLTDSQTARDNAPNIGAAPTSGLNIGGQRARANLVNVDGADYIDNSTNGVRSTVSQEAVQEFQVINNSYAAEYGRASGGVVNIITRSGSNEFHGDVFGYLRNRDFQAVNPFSNVPNPAYTRVQAGAAFGGPIKKDKTYFYFAYEITRRHETGFSSIGQNNFGLVPFDASPYFGAPAGTFGIQVTPQQAAFLANPGSTPIPEVQAFAFSVGAASAIALNGSYPASFALLPPTLVPAGLQQFPLTCNPALLGAALQCPGLPTSFLPLASQTGNFPVFEGTSLYSLRLDHNFNQNNRLMLRANVSPSTVTGIEVNGENQVFGQNAYSRTSQQTYRDVAGVAQDTWTIGSNKINEFRFQYARRGLSYFYSSGQGGSAPASNIYGFAFIGREPYSFIDRTEQRYQFTDNFSWVIGTHAMKFGGDFNYIPVDATFTVNYGGVYDFGSITPVPGFPSLSPVQAYGAGIPQDFIQGIGNPHDSFSNKPLGLFWQDSWRFRPNITVNYGLRYDIEFPPSIAPPTGLALSAYNQLGIQKGINTDTNNIQPRIGIAWDPRGDGKDVIRASYGIFYDHPLLGLYFLGDASDGSKSGQLLFFGANPGCSAGAGSPLNLTANNIFQGLAGTCFPAATTAFGYQPNQQIFNSFYPNSLFINQGYINNGVPLISQPFGYPQSKNFVYAYSQQVNLTWEHDLGHGYAFSLGYNFNGGRHLNRPINANPARGDLLTANWQGAVAAKGALPTDIPLSVASCGVNPIPGSPLPYYVPAALVSFFRPSGINPSLAGGAFAPCVPLALADLAATGLNAKCNPLATGLADCVPFSDMDANYSNGSSVYHGFTSTLRKRFSQHYDFLASYTYAHTIDDSTDLQSPLAPQDSFYPYYNYERSSSLFDQRHRFVFSGVYQSGKISGDGFVPKFFSYWTISPIFDVESGRPFNIITGTSDNFQFDPSGARPNIVPAGTPTNLCGYPTYASKYSPSGYLQEVCFANVSPAQLAGPNALLALDGNLGRNAGTMPWNFFNDIRFGKQVFITERVSINGTVDMFNIINKNNTAAVNVLVSNAGQPTAAFDPRQFQFGLKVLW